MDTKEQRFRTDNPTSMYVSGPHNCLDTHCGKNGHLEDTCTARFGAIERNMQYLEQRSDPDKRRREQVPQIRINTRQADLAVKKNIGSCGKLV